MRCGSLGYCTTQGIGYLLKDFTDHGVVDDVLLKRYPRDARENHVEWYPPGTPLLHGRDLGTQHHKVVRDWFDRIDVALFFESPLDWGLLRYARSLGKPTAIMTMYEWWPESPPALPDLLLCPSDLDYDVFAERTVAKEYPRVARLNVPAPTGTWRRRTTARRFLHNAGHVGSRNHKGTDTLLAAMEFVTAPLELTVRCQDEGLLNKLIREAGTWASGKPWRVNLRPGEVPRESLFGEEFDVYVAPEKYNGLSLPLQEAFAAGMPVVTTDRYPSNTWLPRETLVPVASTRRVRVASGHLEIDESVVEPRDLARVLDGLYDQDVTRFSDAGRAWAEENSWAALGPKYRAALEGLL
jgi:glycosyltransferase involved in cell wall biosynthesis